MSGLRHVIQAVCGTPWAILPERLHAIADVLAFQANGGKLEAAEIRARVGDKRGTPQAAPAIAVLPLYGIIGHRMNQVQDISGPGGTSTEQFSKWFDAAMADDSIGAIVIDIDSPGGTVTGVPELAAKIHAARGKKRVIGIANGLAASAAYWIGSACEEFWCIPSGDVGSIGVYAMHSDLSAAYERAGVTNTLIAAGRFKTEGNPYEPLDDEAKAAMQERVDDYYNDFTRAVARYRGVGHSAVTKGFGEGRIVSAVNAKRLGMVDTIGTIDGLLGALSGSPAGNRARLTHASRMDTRGAPMSDNEQDTDSGWAEQSRVEALATFAASEKLPASTLTKWIHGGVSLVNAQREVMSDIRASHASATAIRTNTSALGNYGLPDERSPLQTAISTTIAGPKNVKVEIDLPTPTRFSAAHQGINSGPDGGFGVSITQGMESYKDNDSATTPLATARILSSIQSWDGATVEITTPDEHSFAGGPFGGKVSRLSEGGTATAKKLKLNQLRLSVSKVGIYVDQSSEVLQDNPRAMAKLERMLVAGVEWYRIHDILLGDGVAKPKGVLGSSACKTVAKEGSQGSDTITYGNIVDLFAALHPACLPNAFFLANHSCSPQLMKLAIEIGDGGTHIPAVRDIGGNMTILGVPLYFTDILPVLGERGDILLGDFTQYAWTEVPRGELERADTPGWYEDLSSIRVIRRWDGMPTWNGFATGFDGREYASFATLEAR